MTEKKELKEEGLNKVAGGGSEVPSYIKFIYPLGKELEQWVTISATVHCYIKARGWYGYRSCPCYYLQPTETKNNAFRGWFCESELGLQYENWFAIAFHKNTITKIDGD